MIDWTKPIQTKDGKKAEFIRAFPENGNHASHLVVIFHNGAWACAYRADGRHAFDPGLDLVNVKPELPHNAKFKVAFALGFRVKFLEFGREFPDVPNLLFTAPSSQYSIHPDDAEAFEKIWAAIEAAR